MKENASRRHAADLLLAVLTIAALLVVLYLAGSRLMPHRYDYGSVWESYLQEEPDTVDVLFFGSSMTYCDVMPAAVWRETGLTSFVMAGPEQTPEVMLAYVREALKTQRGACVTAEISGAFFDRTTGYSKVNVGYMPFSLNRIRAALGCEREMLRLAVFPIGSFHSELLAPQPSITDLTAEDGRMLCGYTLLEDAAPQTDSVDRDGLHLPGTDAYESHARALEALVRFCREENVRLVCYFAPATARIPAEARETLRARLLAAGCEHVWDLTDEAPSFGIDSGADWYDSLHFNRFGAEKFSAGLAQRLLELGVTPGGRGDEALWEARADYLLSK